MIDGIRVGRPVVVAWGNGQAGHQQILGLTERATENSTVVKSLLTDWVERAVAHADGALAGIDGAKALREVFGDTVVMQRCIVHTMRNVLDHVPDSAHTAMVWKSSAGI